MGRILDPYGHAVFAYAAGSEQDEPSAFVRWIYAALKFKSHFSLCLQWPNDGMLAGDFCQVRAVLFCLHAEMSCMNDDFADITDKDLDELWKSDNRHSGVRHAAYRSEDAAEQQVSRGDLRMARSISDVADADSAKRSVREEYSDRPTPRESAMPDHVIDGLDEFELVALWTQAGEAVRVASLGRGIPAGIVITPQHLPRGGGASAGTLSYS